MSETKTASRRRRRPRLLPAGLRREEAAQYCGVSVAAWDRAVASGAAPAPIRVAGCLVWLRRSLQAWLEFGAPSRADFEVMVAATRK